MTLRRGSRRTCASIATLVMFLSPVAVFPEAEQQASATTQIVLLGTGTPSRDPDRSGPATAIVVNGTPYLIDFGPGVVRRMAAASQKGVAGLGLVDVRVAFVTHLHSDHTAGYADLILTPWSIGRGRPLEVYGPKGLEHMTDHILEAYKEDIAIRRRDKQVLGVPEQADGYKVNVHEITPGTVYKDQNVTVKAFLVNHGDAPQAFAYRIGTPDRTIVISGDAAPSQSVIDSCNRLILYHRANPGGGRPLWKTLLAREPNRLDIDIAKSDSTAHDAAALLEAHAHMAEARPPRVFAAIAGTNVTGRQSRAFVTRSGHGFGKQCATTRYNSLLERGRHGRCARRRARRRPAVSQIAELVARPPSELSRQQPGIPIRARTELFDERPAMPLVRAASPWSGRRLAWSPNNASANVVCADATNSPTTLPAAPGKVQESTLHVQPETQSWGAWAVA